MHERDRGYLNAIPKTKIANLNANAYECREIPYMRLHAEVGERARVTGPSRTKKLRHFGLYMYRYIR